MRPTRNQKAISPTVATIIIVAIAIAIAIAAGVYWSGIIERETGFETLDLIVNTDYGDFYNFNNTYKVTINMKNTGTIDTTIDGIYINNKPFWDTDVLRVDFNIENVTQSVPMKFILPVAKRATMEIIIASSSTFKHGNTIEVRLHTAAGSSIIQTQRLP